MDDVTLIINIGTHAAELRVPKSELTRDELSPVPSEDFIERRLTPVLTVLIHRAFPEIQQAHDAEVGRLLALGS